MDLALLQELVTIQEKYVEEKTKADKRAAAELKARTGNGDLINKADSITNSRRKKK